MRNNIVGFRPMDLGKVLENAVYNQLVYKGYEVKVGVMSKDREIDFVARRDGEQRYIQVALNVNDPATAQREFGNLADIPDNYRKTIVTLRDSFPNTQNGIDTISLREFLME